jgi:hypothetical protein
MSSTTKTPSAVDAITDQYGKAIGASKKISLQYIDSYEQAMLQIADAQEKTAKESQIDWIASIGGTHANAMREATSSYVSAVRQLIK